MQLTVAIPSFNRMEMTLACFYNIIHDDRVGEVVICDDASEPEIYESLAAAVGGMDKVKLFRNERNVGCYQNKKRAVELSSNEWVIIADSDNTFSVDYLDVLFSNEWEEGTIMAPQIGFPALNYSQWGGMTFDKSNAASYIDKGNFAMLLNTFNFFINRKKYLSVFDAGVEPWTSDSIYFCYCWFAAGNRMKVIPGLSYEHRIHSQSHYTLHNQKAPGFYESVIEKIKSLK